MQDKQINYVNKYVDNYFLITSQLAVIMERGKHIFQQKLGKRIKDLREQNGLNQSQLAIECDKDRQSINRLEKGDVNPSAYYLFQISKALDVPLKELFDF